MLGGGFETGGAGSSTDTGESASLGADGFAAGISWADGVVEGSNSCVDTDEGALDRSGCDAEPSQKDCTFDSSAPSMDVTEVSLGAISPFGA
jgi:hypothetical protein